ncbi:MAG: lipid II flippase MurJ [Verrucomicrobiota bacterium]|jgi:O-antigen/teichoic acid export membrane protein
MLAEKIETAPDAGHKHHIAFFRQSGWLMIATIAGGVLMWGVHFLSKKIPASEYGILVTLFSVAGLIPTMPFQMVFAQQTAHALALNRDRQLAGMIRTTWLGTFLVWLAAAVVVLFFQNRIVANWHLSNPVALWMLLLVILFSLWMPMFAGIMQGQQNFLWLGWSSLFGAAGRLGSAIFIVLVLNGAATGIMAGVFIGVLASNVVGIWQTRSLWRGETESFDWHELLRQVIPLIFGFAAAQFLFLADTSFVDTYFGADKTAPYGAAGTLSRALMWLVLPLAAVMFPKIVHSTARAEKTNLLGVVLLGTAILIGVGILGLWLLGPWMIRFVYPPEYVSATLAVLPWYAGAMIPLALANVLVNDLLARARFQAVPVLVVLAVAYGVALTQFHDSLVTVLKILGLFNLLLLGVCAWFSFGSPRSKV